MLRDDGIVKILDFGLAKLIGPEILPEEATEGEVNSDVATASLAITNSSGVMGTVAYMSPEQARGQADIDSRTDIWSLGIVAYEMLAGVTPFSGESPGDVIGGIMRSEPAPLSSFANGIPPELERIVERSLRKDPKDRYENANELLDDIRRLKSDLDFRSKLENDPQIPLALKRPRVRKAGQTSPLRPTDYLPVLNETNDPDPYTTGKRKVSTPSGRLFGTRGYGIAALLALITAGVVGAVYVRSAMITKPDVFMVDTTADDPSMTACTSAPNDCSIGGAIANANTDGPSNTIVFDGTVFDSHQTIHLKSGFAILPGRKLTIDGPAAGVTLLLATDTSAADSQTPFRRLFALFESDIELEIRNLTLSGGNTFQGGGIYNEKGTVTVINSVITGNSSTEAGGGITNRIGKLTVINSTVSNNSSLTGGGIANINGTMTLINTILADNTAPLGGGIRNERGVLTLIHSTVSENSASSGGGIFDFNGTTNLHNSIIANSRSGGDCLLYSDTINAEYSLIEDGLTCVNGANKNNLTGDPNLGSPAENGGLNFTHTLLPGSIAIDAGSVSLAVDAAGQTLATDRRGVGFPRVASGTVDLGAFEYQSPTRQDQCENEGWKNYSNPPFPGQDQCIDLVRRTTHLRKSK